MDALVPVGARRCHQGLEAAGTCTRAFGASIQRWSIVYVVGQPRGLRRVDAIGIIAALRLCQVAGRSGSCPRLWIS